MKRLMDAHRHVAIARSEEVLKLKGEVRKLKSESGKLKRAVAFHKCKLNAKDAELKKLQASAARQKKALADRALRGQLVQKNQEIAGLKRLLTEYAHLRDWRRSAERAHIPIHTTAVRRASKYLHDLGDMAGP